MGFTTSLISRRALVAVALLATILLLAGCGQGRPLSAIANGKHGTYTIAGLSAPSELESACNHLEEIGCQWIWIDGTLNERRAAAYRSFGEAHPAGINDRQLELRYLAASEAEHNRILQRCREVLGIADSGLISEVHVPGRELILGTGLVRLQLPGAAYMRNNLANIADYLLCELPQTQLVVSPVFHRGG